MEGKKRILIICPYPENVAPGQRLKYEQYFNYFRENNIDVVVSPFMTMHFWNIVYKRGFYLQKILWTFFGYLRRLIDLFRLPFYDCVYIHLWVTPFGPPTLEFLFCRINKKVVYDIDDMIFLGHASKANKFIASLKGQKKIIYLMKHAKHVIVCTPRLDEFVKKYNPYTTDISSTINTDIYIPVNKYKNDKTITIGWSGSHSTSKYVHLLETVFRRLLEKYKFNLLIIGDASFSFDSIPCEAVLWNEKSEISLLQRIDIGVYPLPMDDEWVYGKSGLKALQYMALGIPAVATAIGANFRVIESGVSGFLVQSEDEWVEKLSMLIENPELRKSLGTEGRKRVIDHYSINANKDIYLDVLEKVINNE